jgi:hypothetical protein
MFHKHIQKNKNEKSFKKFFFVFFECVCESRTSGLKDLAESRTPVSSSTLRVHVSQTHSKKTKTKKVLKNFFLLSFWMCFWFKNHYSGLKDLAESRIPVSSSTLREFMFHKHIQKNKNEKSFKKFFFVFFECVCESRTSGLKDLAESRTPVSSSTLRVHVSQTHSKKTKTKKVLKNFFLLSFWMCFWFKNHYSGLKDLAESRIPVSSSTLREFMFHKHIQKNKNEKSF